MPAARRPSRRAAAPRRRRAGRPAREARRRGRTRRWPLRTNALRCAQPGARPGPVAARRSRRGRSTANSASRDPECHVLGAQPTQTCSARWRSSSSPAGRPWEIVDLLQAVEVEQAERQRIAVPPGAAALGVERGPRTRRRLPSAVRRVTIGAGLVGVARSRAVRRARAEQLESRASHRPPALAAALDLVLTQRYEAFDDATPARLTVHVRRRHRRRVRARTPAAAMGADHPTRAADARRLRTGALDGTRRSVSTLRRGRHFIGRPAFQSSRCSSEHPLGRGRGRRGN